MWKRLGHIYRTESLICSSNSVLNCLWDSCGRQQLWFLDLSHMACKIRCSWEAPWLNLSTILPYQMISWSFGSINTGRFDLFEACIGKLGMSFVQWHAGRLCFQMHLFISLENLSHTHNLCNAWGTRWYPDGGTVSAAVPSRPYV